MSGSAAPSRYRSIGRLKLFEEDVLGSGGNGSVYKGMFEANLVAVKKIPLTQSFAIEAELRHMDFGSECPENLAKYFYQEKDKYFLYIVMELCVGTLEDLVSGKLTVSIPGPKEESLRQITVGLQYLHSKDIIHRDVKPSNVLVSNKGIIKLADFGMSKKGRIDRLMTSNSGNFGTAEWAAPEFLNKAPRFDYSADVFSLGCVFVYTVTGGKHPFGETPIERVSNIERGHVKKEIMDAIEQDNQRQLINSMVLFKPEERPKLNVVLVNLLERLLWYQIDNLDERGDEFVTTIDRIASQFHSPSAIQVEGSSLLLAICKSSSKNKYKCAGKLLSLSELLCVDVNATDEENRNALLLLVQKVTPEESEDILSLANLLVDKKINVNEKTKSGFTALGLAIRSCCSFGFVQLLLENGVDPNVHSGDGWTPINLACRYYQTSEDLSDVLKLLIAKGATLDHCTASGNNALTLLAVNYQRDNLADVMAILIEAGVDINSKSKRNWNALLILCNSYRSAEGLFPAVRYLVKKGINTKERTYGDGLTVLHLLMTRRFENNERNIAKIVKFLLKHDAEPDVPDNNGWTPLLLACQFYHRDDFIRLATYLIHYGANPDRRLSTGDNALTLVTTYRPHQKNMEDVIKLLVDNGADVNCRSIFNWNPLMKLFRYSQNTGDELLPAVKLLTRNGINVNEKDNKRGWSALHILVMYFGNERSNERLSDIVKFLLDNGAEADHCGNDGWTPLLLACQYYQKNDFVTLVDLLLKHRAQANRQLSNGSNALVLAALFQTHETRLAYVFGKLISAGADVNCKDASGWNALMIVCRFFKAAKGYFAAIKILVERKTRVNERLKDGWTALHLLCKYFGDERQDYLADVLYGLIFLYGADTGAVTKDGNTPVQLASQCYHREDKALVMQYLSGSKATAGGYYLTESVPINAIIYPSAYDSSSLESNV